MKTMRIACTAALAGLLLYASSMAAAAAEVVNAVAAVVNGEVITLYEIDTTAERIAMLKGIPTSDPKMSELKRQILQRMIEDKLLQQELNRLGVEISDEQVEKRLAQILKENNMTEDRLTAVLKTQGKTLSEFREDLRKQLGMEEYVRYKLRAGSLDVSDEEALTYYRLNSDEFAGEPTVSLLIMRWTYSEDNLKTAEAIYGRFTMGAMPLAESEFDRIAEQAGAKVTKLEGIKESELRSDIRSMIQGLKAPSCAGIHKGSDEITLVVLLKRSAADVVPFEKAKVRIKRMLKNRKLEREFKLLIDELYRKSRVEVRIQF